MEEENEEMRRNKVNLIESNKSFDEHLKSLCCGFYVEGYLQRIKDHIVGTSKTYNDLVEEFNKECERLEERWLKK